MTPAWAQRQEELLSDCVVFPDVFDHMVDRLRDFVVPYQHALETEASQRNMHRYLAGLLSHLDRKNAETIAAFVDVERLVLQEFIGTAPWPSNTVAAIGPKKRISAPERPAWQLHIPPPHPPRPMLDRRRDCVPFDAH